MNLRGIVARSRVNAEGSGRPAVESEFVKADPQGVLALSSEPVVEWTTERRLARELPWDEAQTLAGKLGWPTHAITVSSAVDNDAPECFRDERSSHPVRHSSVSPTEVFERLDRQHLA